jgi:hypothetical protein
MSQANGMTDVEMPPGAAIMAADYSDENLFVGVG